MIRTWLTVPWALFPASLPYSDGRRACRITQELCLDVLTRGHVFIIFSDPWGLTSPLFSHLDGSWSLATCASFPPFVLTSLRVAEFFGFFLCVLYVITLSEVLSHQLDCELFPHHFYGLSLFIVSICVIFGWWPVRHTFVDYSKTIVAYVSRGATLSE